MNADPAARRTDGAAQPRLWFTLWGWTCAALVLVWATLLVAAWLIGHHEAEEITDGQLEAVARLWMSVEPDKTLSIPEPIASSRSRAYVQDVVQVAPHWKLVGGLRYDHLQGDYDSHSIPNSAPNPHRPSPWMLDGKLRRMPRMTVPMTTHIKPVTRLMVRRSIPDMCQFYCHWS